MKGSTNKPHTKPQIKDKIKSKAESRNLHFNKAIPSAPRGVETLPTLSNLEAISK